MSDLKKIADELYSKSKTRSHQDFIDSFEKNQKEINAADHNSSDDSYDLYSRIIADYAIALAQTENYKRALPLISKALDLLQNNSRISKDQLCELKFYETLLFNRALCNYQINRFKFANADIELLKKLYPENKEYPKWTAAIRYKRLNRLKNIMWFTVLAAVIIESFFLKTNLVKDILLGIGLICLIIAIYLEVSIYKTRKKRLA